MKNRRKVFKIILSLILLVIVFTMYFLSNSLKITEQTQYSSMNNTQTLKEGKTVNIENWKERVNSYASRIGIKKADGSEEQKWLFKDTQNA